MQKSLLILASLLIFALSACNGSAVPASGQLTIGDIQGCAHRSPYEGKRVENVEGIVTHKFSNGFSFQSLLSDSRDCTSDALFVKTEGYPKVTVGQVLRIDGVVVEYTPGNESDHNLSLTEIHEPQITLIRSDANLPDPIELGASGDQVPLNWVWQTGSFNIQENGVDYYESLEFMLVEVRDGIVVGPKNDYNEFFVLPSSLMTDNVLSPEGVLLQRVDDENPEKIMVNAAASFTQKVNVGDRLQAPIIGIMNYSYGNYQIWTIQNPVIDGGEIAGSDFETEKGTLSIATYNLENFSRYDDAARIKKIGCQFARDMDSPDIIVLNEVLDDSGVQDDGTVSAELTLQTLVDAILSCGGAEYGYSDNPPQDGSDGGITGGNIRTAVIYRLDTGISLKSSDGSTNKVSVSAGDVYLGTNPVRLFANETVFRGTRKPTLWAFNWNGETILLMGVHLISQSASTPAWGDVQPPEKPEQQKREQQMQMIVEFIEDLLMQSSDVKLILAGDFNDYPWSNTLSIATTGGVLVQPDDQLMESNYTYIHDGNGFQFDYLLMTEALAARFKDVTILHINTLFDASRQISDHDPVIITFGR